MTKCYLSQKGYDVFKPQCFPVSQIPLMGLTSNIICHPYLSPLCPQLRLHPQSLSLCFLPHKAPAHASTSSGSATAVFSYRFVGTSLTDLEQMCPRALPQAPPSQLPYLSTTLYQNFSTMASLSINCFFFLDDEFQQDESVTQGIFETKRLTQCLAYGRFFICIY